MILDKQYTLHLPGNGKKRLGDFLYTLINPISIHDDVTLITVATPNVIDDCPLIKQLNISNIDYLNAGLCFNTEYEWNKVDKIPLIGHALFQVKTPYVLIMDANDAIITKDINEEFIEKWKNFDCDILYNASECFYPKDSIIHDRELDPYNIIHVQHYLNAGVCFGKTEYAKSIYAEAYRQRLLGEFKFIDSEQYYIRIAWLKHPRMKLDMESELFLLSHGN